jgi:hypothetical protein
MTTDTQANLAIGFEATGRCEETKGWRSKRVGWREDNAPVVDAVSVRGFGGSTEGEMPFEEVCLKGDGVIVC